MWPVPVVCGMFAVSNPTWAQNIEKSAGTISEFGPDTIGLRSATSREPVRYISSQTTIYIDDAGDPVLSIDSLKAGVPVTMYYIIAESPANWSPAV
jgi:hypothetical protein